MIYAQVREQGDGAGDVVEANGRCGTRGQEDPNVSNLHGVDGPNVEVHEEKWQLPCVKAVQASHCLGTEHLPKGRQGDACAHQCPNATCAVDQCQLLGRHCVPLCGGGARKG